MAAAVRATAAEATDWAEVETATAATATEEEARATATVVAAVVTVTGWEAAKARGTAAEGSEGAG